MNAARTFKLAALALATALLGAGAWLTHSEFRQLALERQQFAQLQQSLNNARNLMSEVEQRERLVRSLNEVAMQVDRLGFDPTRWGERKLRRPLGPATRVETALFMGELGRGGAGSIFVADEFEIATATSDTGLFHSPEPGDKGLALAVSGTLYFQTASVGRPVKGFP